MSDQNNSPRDNNRHITQETAERLITLLNPTVKSFEIAKKPVVHIRNSQLLAGITGTVGLIMFAFGIENFIGKVPQLRSPLVEIAIGVILLLASGLFLKKLN